MLRNIEDHNNKTITSNTKSFLLIYYLVKPSHTKKLNNNITSLRIYIKQLWYTEILCQCLMWRICQLYHQETFIGKQFLYGEASLSNNVCCRPPCWLLPFVDRNAPCYGQGKLNEIHPPPTIEWQWCHPIWSKMIVVTIYIQTMSSMLSIFSTSNILDNIQQY